MQSAVINELEHPAITVSHERGPTDSQLLEETIGQRLRSVTERFGGREAASSATRTIARDTTSCPDRSSSRRERRSPPASARAVELASGRPTAISG